MCPELTRENFQAHVEKVCGRTTFLGPEDVLKLMGPQYSIKTVYNARAKGSLTLQGTKKGIYDWVNVFDYFRKEGFIRV